MKVRFNVFTMKDLIGCHLTVQQFHYLNHRILLPLTPWPWSLIGTGEHCEAFWTLDIHFALINALYYSHLCSVWASFVLKSTKRRVGRPRQRRRWATGLRCCWRSLWKICRSPPWILIVSTGKLLAVITTGMWVVGTAVWLLQASVLISETWAYARLK